MQIYETPNKAVDLKISLYHHGANNPRCLIRNSDPIFYPDSSADVSIRNQMQKNYDDCINVLQTQWYQADLDDRFCMGDQDLWGLLFPGVSSYRKKIFNFNLCQAARSTVSGYQRRNRKSSIVVPIHKESQKTSDQMTKALFHVINKAGIYQTYSDCFEKGALNMGLGFCFTYLDKTEDVISGDIKKRFIDMRSTLFDPYFRRHDMMDCRFWWVRTFFDRNEAATLYKEYADEILSLPKGSYRDDRFYYMPEVYQIQFPNLVGFDEYYYLTSREATYLIDKESEECQEWVGDEEQLRDIMRRKYRQPDGSLVEGRKLFTTTKAQKPTVRRAILVNDKLLVDEKNPLGVDRYPCTAALGYFNCDTPYYAYKFRGLIRDMRDPQYLMNRLEVNCLDQVEAQQHGIKMEKGALVTPDDALNSGNGRVLTTQNGMFDKVEKLHIDPPSPVLLQMVESLKALAEYISGVTPEMMGQEIDDKAGIITMIRNTASITRLMPLFDQFDEFQRLDGDLTIDVMQKNFTFGKMRQILGEDPTPEFDNKLFYKYGCKVVQGVLTETQQQLEAQQLIYAKEALQMPISSKRILQAMTLQNKDELMQEVAEAEKAQAQMAQQRAQLEMQQLQVDNQTKLSYAEEKSAAAKEKSAKIRTDMALAEQKLEEAKDEKTHSLLNLIKAIKEIQSIDLEHIGTAFDILKGLQEPEEKPEAKPQKEAI